MGSFGLLTMKAKARCSIASAAVRLVS